MIPKNYISFEFYETKTKSHNDFLQEYWGIVVMKNLGSIKFLVMSWL